LIYRTFLRHQNDPGETQVYETARTAYRNISRELAAEYNLFVELDDQKLHIK
jgi:hypothetical protein